jgi:hypothetical protein
LGFNQWWFSIGIQICKRNTERFALILFNQSTSNRDLQEVWKERNLNEFVMYYGKDLVDVEVKMFPKNDEFFSVHWSKLDKIFEKNSFKVIIDFVLSRMP